MNDTINYRTLEAYYKAMVSSHFNPTYLRVNAVLFLLFGGGGCCCCCCCCWHRQKRKRHVHQSFKNNLFLFPFFTFQNHKVLTIPHLLQHIFSWESVLLSLLRIRVVILWRLEPYRVLSSFSFSFYCNYRRQMFIHLFVLYFNQIN